MEMNKDPIQLCLIGKAVRKTQEDHPNENEPHGPHPLILVSSVTTLSTHPLFHSSVRGDRRTSSSSTHWGQ